MDAKTFAQRLLARLTASDRAAGVAAAGWTFTPQQPQIDDGEYGDIDTDRRPQWLQDEAAEWDHGWRK